MSVLAYGLNITLEEYHKLVKKAKKWKPDYPKTCPRCGAKTKTTAFDDGWEIWCMYNDASKFNPIKCDWETWILNPTHPSNNPEYKLDSRSEKEEPS